MIRQEKRYRGIVVFDVDGVIFRDFLLKRLILKSNKRHYFKVISLGIKYYKNKIEIDQLLNKGYKLVRGISSKEALKIASKIKKSKNIDKTISILKEKGFFVSLISAGIPEFIMKKLAQEFRADHFRGLNIPEDSADLSTENIKLISKVKIVEDLLKQLNLTWDKVISIGDDPNNLELFKKSSISIGFNPSKIIRKEATVIIEGNNFLEILPYILKSSELPKKINLKYLRWRKEIFRKLIHLFGAGVPFLAHYFSKTFTIISLASVILIYFISEILRHHGLSFLLISKITKKAQRFNETRNIIMGPVLLGIGILLTIILFDYKFYMPSVIVVSVSDTLSAIVGNLFGKHFIPGLKNSTIEGSVAFFVSSIAILLPFFDPLTSTITAITATIMEAIPVYNLDNIIIPLGTSLMLYLFSV